ncbi:MAG: carboxynorspermidine decarboxylase [Bacteroidales bacterium]|nr:carboxynorspermidine decarboxylase [Bacteroidales bacterium]MBD5209060.1 carboxynorspermidine decarboxylase [Bacteroidales bacterium]
MNVNNIPTPFYIVYEDRLRRNMEKLSHVATEADLKIIMAFKANALWKTFPVIREYFTASTASSLNEMKLSLDFLGNDVHAYCPVYTDSTFPEFLKGCSHITFNSLNQFRKFEKQIADYNSQHPEKRVSAGLRVNPHCSVIETDIYNPCVPGSRFGENPENLTDGLPNGIEGLHFHALCESSSYDLEKVLDAFKKEYGHLLPDLKWLNMGGGHLITRKDYDVDHLINLMKKLHEDYPNLQLIIEPGSAFTWQTGDLVTSVLDVVEDAGIKTGIIDASFACHMPDCLEMPYKPVISEALPESEESSEGFSYRLGGNSCLSGDFVGDWQFKDELTVGQRLTLKDMNHYTTVKTNMFNGIQHPSIWFQPIDGDAELLKEFTYEDYRDRMD